MYEGTDYGDEEDEEGTEEEIIEKVIYNNPSFSRVKIESCYEKLMKILYKYISIFLFNINNLFDKFRCIYTTSFKRFFRRIFLQQSLFLFY